MMLWQPHSTENDNAASTDISVNQEVSLIFMADVKYYYGQKFELIIKVSGI